MASSFGGVLEQLAGGTAYQDLGDRLTEIVLAVQETRKMGELSLRLVIKPNGERGIIIADTIKAKIPERARGETVFFTTSAGHLMRNDPRQQDLPLRQVGNHHDQPLRVIDSVTGEILHEGAVQ